LHKIKSLAMIMTYVTAERGCRMPRRIIDGLREEGLRELRDIAKKPESIFMPRQVEVLGELESMNVFRGTRFENALTGTPLNFSEDDECVKTSTYCLAGERTTDESGVWTLRLLDVVCGRRGP